ncbi:immunogenic protein [Faecalicatena sp. AGMB00832]|uniref:Immunogenic protein n=1 Tax=Faecalicatena faecalis TaxID=2726362 RepID=A0ABS6D1R2_9FIRM|nr:MULTISPECIES: immunogenic protein [Faecalicatena]MBU3875431.1 immunogenic protein [Faecalicatena faecalis]MCI6468026.1 immunogenic protein [Faecalicatena sp.]MDY5618503.1 immunogenic protein [Lachnospiraceae bacterium]
MKKVMIILSIICVSGLFGCSKSKNEPYVVNTFEETSEELINAYPEDSKVIITTKYYEMSDGTWKTDEYTYKYKLEVTGRLRNAARDSTFVILSNIENITFEQAWKASGLSSSMSDYFKVEDAVIVGIS